MPAGDNQPHQKISDAELVENVPIIGVAATARKYGLDVRTVYKRASRLGVQSPLGAGGVIKQKQEYPHRIPLAVPNGHIVIAGDAHYWPGEPSLMHRALVHIIKRLREERKLKAVVMNGDVTDFAAISRWPLVNWEKRPTVQDEIEVCQERMHEIAEAAGRLPKLWPAGNHDLRFNIHIAQHAPELANVKGVHLKDHFPLWQACWSVEINGNTIVKHRMSGGIHAVYNNVLKSGVHVITSHLHSANVLGFTDYRGTRWGMDVGCIAETNGPQFLYLEDGPRNWRSAFGVVEYQDGELLQPQLVLPHPTKSDCVTYCGETVRVPQ